MEPRQHEVGRFNAHGWMDARRARAARRRRARGRAGAASQRKETRVAIASQTVRSRVGCAVQHRNPRGPGTATHAGDPLHDSTGRDCGGERRDQAVLPDHTLLHFHGEQRGVVGRNERDKVGRSHFVSIAHERPTPKASQPAPG